jgi:glucans biosynthesis protein
MAWALWSCALLAATPAKAADTFDFDTLAQRAQEAAKRPYEAPRSPDPTLPTDLRHLSYDAVRDIRFRPPRALWREQGPFELMFFHRSGRTPDAIRLHEISEQGVRDIPYAPRDFDFGANKGLATSSWGDIGLAGWRAHYPLHSTAYKDEVVAFLGASYFRALGAHQRYGLSARGLIINPVGPGPEEFPRFTEYWMLKPARGATQLTFFALMESASLTGAFRFDLRPGEDTTMDVRARLFTRAPISTLGVAPLTSMFLFGENQPSPTDFRPEVHDSDGLMVAIDGPQGEWIWRPLINPPGAPLLTAYQVARLKGFGLMQRDRAFVSYQDTEARYELRPSVWVEPLGDWGSGQVNLLQLHADDETYDNVTAYWTSGAPTRTPIAAGQRLDLAYRLHWQGLQDQKPPQAWVVQSRVGHGWHVLPPDQVQYVVDFAGPALKGLSADAPVRAVLTAGSNSEILHSNVFFNEAAGTWRMTVNVRWTNRSTPLELRGFLKLADQTVSETWSPIMVQR